MTKHPDLFAALAAEFRTDEVKVRTQNGRQLSYITARVAMNRLDNVLGPENWWDRYVAGEHSVLCELTIRLPDGSTLTKSDAGGYAGLADEGDDDKSGYSDSFKRAAVKFGVARYLYRDGVPSFAPEPPATSAPVSATNGPHKETGKWGNGRAQPEPQPQRQPAAAVADGPRSGKALFAWTKEQEQRHQVRLLGYLNQWGKLQEFPGRMVDWDANQVALGYAEAQRKLAAAESQETE